MLTRKAESARGQVVEFNTQTTALSQTSVCGRRAPKRLSERVHRCICGVVMQRDLFSAYLARFVRDDTLQLAKASESWPGAELLLDGLAAGYPKPTCETRAEALVLCPLFQRSESERVAGERILAWFQHGGSGDASPRGRRREGEGLGF